MTTNYSWHDFYTAAVLETDWTKVEERVRRAESEMHKRRLVLSQDHGGTLEERKALANAFNGIRVLRMDAASWLERKSLDGKSLDGTSQGHRRNSSVRNNQNRATASE